ncbi:MAG: glycosyltransferase family 4 protein [Candidatus Hydrogenedens sp.]|nr:glycosyltransferase family 4 protein [Candidatus Hydrogenedens sp.]
MGKNAQKATRIFVDSEATARDVEELLSIPSSRIDVIPLGVDNTFRPASQQERKALRAKIDLPKDFFLFVGTLEPRKNLPTLIRAWAGLPVESPDLVLAGRLGWKVSREELLALSGCKSDRLHFLDHVPGTLLPTLYSEARAFVYPSLMEGFGLPPLEAMACGTPVITSKTSSMPEVTGDAAMLVSPTDEEELAGALEWLAGNENLREELSKKGLERAAGFTWEKTAALTLEGYKKALEDR